MDLPDELERAERNRRARTPRQQGRTEVNPVPNQFQMATRAAAARAEGERAAAAAAAIGNLDGAGDEHLLNQHPTTEDDEEILMTPRHSGVQSGGETGGDDPTPFVQPSTGGGLHIRFENTPDSTAVTAAGGNGGIVDNLGQGAAVDNEALNNDLTLTARMCNQVWRQTADAIDMLKAKSAADARIWKESQTPHRRIGQ